MNIACMNACVPSAISRIIREKGVKQCAIAERAGLTPREFSDLMNGRKLIKVHDIVSIAKALEVTPNELFATTDDRTA